MRGFHGFEEFISSRGGIVSRKELLAAGWTPDELRIAYGNYRRPTRLRRGWYCSSNVPREVRAAWEHGGPLACVSALRWYRLLPDDPSDTTLHVCLPRHAQRRAVEADAPRTVIVHWLDATAAGGDRWAVSPEVALKQAWWCRHHSAQVPQAAR